MFGIFQREPEYVVLRGPHNVISYMWAGVAQTVQIRSEPDKARETLISGLGALPELPVADQTVESVAAGGGGGAATATAAATAATAAPAAPAATTTTTTAAGVTISDHKRSILVTGETYPIKDTLKSLGGKWNKPLKGWVIGRGKRGARPSKGGYSNLR